MKRERRHQKIDDKNLRVFEPLKPAALKKRPRKTKQKCCAGKKRSTRNVQSPTRNTCYGQNDNWSRDNLPTGPKRVRVWVKSSKSESLDKKAGLADPCLCEGMDINKRLETSSQAAPGKGPPPHSGAAGWAFRKYQPIAMIKEACGGWEKAGVIQNTMMPQRNKQDPKRLSGVVAPKRVPALRASEHPFCRFCLLWQAKH